jgi:hypothetical protein
VIDEAQHPEAPPIKEAIRQDIHAPLIMWPGRYERGQPAPSDPLPPSVYPDPEAYLPIQAKHPLVVDPPSLTRQADMETPVPRAHVSRGEVPQAQAQRRVI